MLRNLLNLLLKLILTLLISGNFYNSFSDTLPVKSLLQKLQHQIVIGDFIGAKLLANKIYKSSTDIKDKEIAFLLFWEASGYLHYKEGKLSQILEDIGGLNLYWGYFRKSPHYEDLYFDILGKLYSLIFQNRRAVIFFVEAYKRNKKTRELLNIIYATEMVYYNELEPYYDIDFIKKLLEKIHIEQLDPFSKALYEFEWGFYFLLKKQYKKAYRYFQKSYNSVQYSLPKGQVNFFIGRAAEGSGLLKKAYYFYRLALKQVKHPLFVKRTLYRLFVVSAKLKFYKEANNYLFALTKFGGLQVNPYLQEAILKIFDLRSFKKFFYWKGDYENLVSSIMWLNIENNRGKRAFVILLKEFLNTEKPFADFLIAWKVLYPHEISKFVKNLDGKKVLNFSVRGLKYLYQLYILNKNLFNITFGDYGYLAIAKYFFLKGQWQKALTFLNKVEVNHPLKFYIKGVILSYEGKPYFLEAYFDNLPRNLKVRALFWLGWGYLLKNRWDLTTLYWEEFLKIYKKKDLFFAISSFYLADHYSKIGMTDKSLSFYKRFLEFLKNQRDYKGLKKWVSLKLYPYYGNRIFKELKVDKNWQALIKYFYIGGESK